MHRLTVALLAAVDAAIAAGVGLAVTLAPFTLIWVFGFGGDADWSALWPATAKVWQLGHTVPLHITLPGEYLAALGLGVEGSSFLLSLAPLAFGAFTIIFAARSGMRASQADAWITGVLVSSTVFGVLAILIAFSSRNAVAAVFTWQAVLLPVLFFAVPAAIGAVVTEWREAGAGFVARTRNRVELASAGWAYAPALIARGGAVVVVGLIGVGAAATFVAILAAGGEIIALFEAGQVDVLGATVITLGQLAYLPTFVVWAMSFVAGPGFALGVGTSVSPASTSVGVIPGIPVLGAIPETASPWWLLLALLPVALGAFAGWIARSRLVAGAGPLRHGEHEPMGARVVITLGIAILSASAAALLAVLASGSLGPGALAEVGPEPGPLALAVGLEVLVGAGILLLSPRRRSPADDGLPPAEAPDLSAADTQEITPIVLDRRPDAAPVD